MSALLTQIEERIVMSKDLNIDFTKVAAIIETSKRNALKKVNEELITMHWSIGELLSQESKISHIW